MKSADFEFLTKLLYDRSGLILQPDKSYLLESRLLPVAGFYNCKDVADFTVLLRARQDPAMMRMVTEAMMTNETLFFRDMRPFDQLKNIILPELMQQRAATRTIRIWCAAASTGQEPYSIAMLCAELKSFLEGWRVEIIATDISQNVIDRARQALYSQFEVQRGLPIQYLMRYFTRDEERWQLSAHIRDMVQFQLFNLMEDPRSLGQFDIVFCRNVLIYFNPPTKTEVLGRIHSALADDGVLYLGGAETILGLTDRFMIMPSEQGIYRPVSAAKTAGTTPFSVYTAAASSADAVTSQPRLRVV